MDDAALAAAVESAREQPASGEVDTEQTKLSEGQIRTLSIPARLKLARGASRSLRAILIRDSNTQVALNWVICKGAMPIPGAKTAEQAQENAGALGWRLTEEEIASLDAVSDSILDGQDGK